MDQKILQSMKRVQIGAKMLFSQIRYRAKPKSKYLFCKKSLILCITTNFGQDKNNFKLFQFSTHLTEEGLRPSKIEKNKFFLKCFLGNIKCFKLMVKKK